MPRKLRVEYPGAIYHVMSRANGTGNIFETDVDRQDFIKTLAETCQKIGFQVHAYCLMRHHFHLVVETPNGNLVTGMRGRSGTIRGIEAKAERILREELKRLRWSEGRYLLRTNLTEEDPAKLWQYYIQLTQVEEAFKNLKGDLGLRPIYHQREDRVEAHIFVSFLAYYLHVTLRRWLRDLAPRR